MTIKQLLTANSEINKVTVCKRINSFNTEIVVQLFTCDVMIIGETVELTDFYDINGVPVYPVVDINANVVSWSIISIHHIVLAL